MRALLVMLSLCAALAHGQPVDAGVVTPPVLVTPSIATYPQALEQSGLTADVVLALTISETGVIADVKLVMPSNRVEFDDAAITAAKGLTFTPAQLDGKPVAVVLEYTYHFIAPRFDAGVSVPVAEIVGEVKTKGTRDVLPAAHLEADDGSTADTDAAGRFTLRLTPGTHVITVTASGHTAATFTETLLERQQLDVVYRLTRPFSTPYETVVRGQADRAEVSRIQLAGPELREVAGTGGEPLRVIMLMPGVAQMGSGLSYPVVRGSVPAATGFYIDGVRVPQLFHLLAGPAVVHPEFIDTIDFYPANAPVLYGNVTGGVVSATSRAPRDKFHVEAGVDLINAGAFVEVPIKETGTNITLSGRISYTGWLLALLAGVADPSGSAKPVADFYDYQARIEQKVGAGSVRLLAFGSSDVVGVKMTDPKAQSPYLTSRFHRVDARWRTPLGPGVFSLGASAGWEDLGIYSEVDGKRAGSFLLSRFLLSARAQYVVPVSETVQLRVSGDVERQVAGFEYSLLAGDDGLFRVPQVMGVISGLAGEVAFTPGTLNLVAGVRAASFHAQTGVQRWALEPRVNARYGLANDWTLKGGVGLFHQPPTLLISLPISDIAGLKDGLQETLQLSLGFEKKLPFGLELSVEAYFNPMFTVLEKSLQEFITGDQTYADRNPAKYGQSYGLEFLLRSPAKGRFFGWISYSLMRSERLRTFPVFGENVDEVTVKQAYVPFAFDQTHTLNVVAGYQLGNGWKVSGTVHLNTGHPETGEVSSRTNSLINVDGEQTWRPVPLDQTARLPLFVRLDGRFSKTFTLKELQLELYLDVFNISISSETLSYTYSQVRLPDGRVVGGKTSLAVPLFLPTFGFKGVY